MDVREIYDRQCERAYRIALLYLKNIYDAQDAVQNIFIKLLEKPQSFENASHEDAWFIVTTKNYCRDLLKSFWKRRVDLGDIPETAAQDGQTYDLMLQMLRLSAKYREVIYLYYYEEYSIKEMAKLLDRKESTIQTQLAAARKKLKLELEKEGLVYEGKQHKTNVRLPESHF